MTSIELLILLPLAFALVLLLTGSKTRNILSILFVGGLILIGLNSYTEIVSLMLPHTFHILFLVGDVALLLYFLQQGIKEKNRLVWSLATVQIVLYSLVAYLLPSENNFDILVDGSFNFMYLVINIVGGIIIVYGLEYIESEEFSTLKKSVFIGTLFFFLSVMNFIVSTNSIETFFLLFELTTLCSYILIGYRKDKISVENALRALWMNQIGGVAILIALLLSIISYETVYFDTLMNKINGFYLLPIAFLVIAGYVKSASIPFNSWLLGAMVAPTPVSAILHSATMVKIAPFLILKITESFTPFLSTTIALFGGFVFMSASFLALSKDYFKEILGLSTIALLALMILLGAIGSEEAIAGAIILIIFHAMAKALLFFQAGILEKVFHLKYVGDIEGLANRSPFVLYMILFGFAVLTLPPFGAFIGKFIGIGSIASEIIGNPFYGLVLIFVSLGSVFLTLLYFKVVTKLFMESNDMDEKEIVSIPKLYRYTSLSLVFLILVGIFYSTKFLTTYQILIPIAIFAITVALFYGLKITKADRVKEYHCGEKEELILSSYYFDIKDSYKNGITYISIGFIVLTIIGGLI